MYQKELSNSDVFSSMVIVIWEKKIAFRKKHQTYDVSKTVLIILFRNT